MWSDLYHYITFSVSLQTHAFPPQIQAQSNAKLITWVEKYEQNLLMVGVIRFLQ